MSVRKNKGSPWLHLALTEGAYGAALTKNKCLSAQYLRVAAWRGSIRAILIVDHSILTIDYYLLTCHTAHQDPRRKYFAERDRGEVKRRAVRRLERPGFQGILTSPQQALIL